MFAGGLLVLASSGLIWWQSGQTIPTRNRADRALSLLLVAALLACVIAVSVIDAHFT